MREKQAGLPLTDLRGSAKDIRATMPGAAPPKSGADLKKKWNLE